MTDWLEQAKQFIWENKEGAIIGGIAGYFFIAPLLTKDASALQNLEAVGLIDVFKSASTSAIDFARTKALWTGTLIGVVIGIIMDMVMAEGWLKKLLK
ncbi:MAG: hypothetical protein HY376_03005 [Candidatus Blackburnbacteria bacterium]|nr:hypothetical protein [Candidatus Blackburnbacteria bacterium]